MNYESWKPAVDCKAIGSWNLHSTLPSGMDFFILLASASGVAGIRGQANYNAGNVYEDAIARYRVSKGEKAISLDLGAMIDDGILTENQALLERVLTYGTLEPITREQYFTMLDYYCNPALPLLSPTASQSAIGLGAGGGSGLETFDYSRIPMLYPLVVQYSTQAMAADGQNQADYREMIAASASFDEAGEIVTQAIIDKLAKSLSVMQDSTSIDRNKPLQMYGVDSLLAIELRNWIVKEFLAEIAVFETQGVSTLETLSRLVAGRSSIKHDKWTVWGDVEEE
jgi:acyl carrier protein